MSRWGRDLQITLSSCNAEAELVDYSPAERGALDFFRRNEAAISKTIHDALAELVAESEARAAELYARRRRETAGERNAERALVYGEDYDEDADEAEEDLGVFAGLFDEPEEEEVWESAPEPKPFSDRFSIHELVLLERNGRCLLGFHGSADWDEEHGLGVVMDGLEILELGEHSVVR